MALVTERPPALAGDRASGEGDSQRRAAGSRAWPWLGLGVLSLAALAAGPVLLQPTVAGTGTGVLVGLVGGGFWLAALGLVGPRRALWVALLAPLLLNLARLPAPRTGAPEWRQVLDRAGQSVLVRPSDQPGPPGTLTLLVEAHFDVPTAAYSLRGATADGAVLDWSCGFALGRQRLVLPLGGGSIRSTAGDVRLSLAGQPARSGAYLVLYGRGEDEDHTLLTGGPVPAAEGWGRAPVVTCTAQPAAVTEAQ